MSPIRSSRSFNNALIVLIKKKCFVFPDEFGCNDDPSLYFIDFHNIKCIDLKSSNQTYVSVKTVKSDLVQGGAIDIDHRERMIYWSDIALWTINRMSLVTGESEVNKNRNVEVTAVDHTCLALG